MMKLYKAVNKIDFLSQEKFDMIGDNGETFGFNEPQMTNIPAIRNEFRMRQYTQLIERIRKADQV
jgi:hypothetical protein